MFTFDDAAASVYTLAYPILEAKRGRATFYVRTDQVGTGSYVTWAQLLEMQTAGWVIGNHTRNHTDLTTLSEADATTEIDNGEADLNAQGITGKTHLAYPSGQYNATVISAAQAAGMITGRTIDGNFIQLIEGYNLFTIPMRQNIVSATSMELVKNWVWDALRDKKVALFLIHAPGPGGDITEADLTDLVDWIANRYIPFLTIDDLYDAMSGSISVAIGP